MAPAGAILENIEFPLVDPGASGFFSAWDWLGGGPKEKALLVEGATEGNVRGVGLDAGVDAGAGVPKDSVGGLTCCSSCFFANGFSTGFAGRPPPRGGAFDNEKLGGFVEVVGGPNEKDGVAGLSVGF